MKLGDKMRAERLLSMLLLLQTKRRVTAEDLARELHVSERTVYRDVDALSLAGIPIYTQPGNNGGIFLDEQYRVSLSGLSENQVLSLFATSEAGPLADIGMERAVKDSLMTLFSTLPTPHQQAVQQMQQRFYIDPQGWFQSSDTSAYLQQLQVAVWEDRRVEFDYQAVGQDSAKVVQVDAYALVAKADKWYLVGRRANGDYRTYRLNRIRQLQVLAAHFERDTDFDLAAYWQAGKYQFAQQMAEEFPPYLVSLQVQPEILWYFSRYLEGQFRQIGKTAADGSAQVEVTFPLIDEAKAHIISMGIFISILSPAELREELRAMAQSMVEHYS